MRGQPAVTLAQAPCVLKVGGKELIEPALGRVANWVAATVRPGVPLVLVHGGGEEVSALCERLGIAPAKVDGQRVTTPEVLPLVEGVLGGIVNSRVVRALAQRGTKAIGASGLSSSFVVASDRAGGRLGLVGEPDRVDASFLRPLLRQGYVPVLAPLASDGRGGVLNVNADLFAAGIAQALGGSLRLLTDVPGVRGARGEVRTSLHPSDARSLIAQGIVHGGMVPKVNAALRALGAGAPVVWVGDLTSLGDPLAGGTWFLPEDVTNPPRSLAPSPLPSSLPLLPARAGAGGG